jgi:hypothetical protein
MKFKLPVFYAPAVLLAFSLPCLTHAADPIGDAKAECSKLASEKTGYSPTNTASGSKSVAKGAAIGAGGGAAVRAVQGKSLLKGAAVGAAAGAAVGAHQRNQSKKQAIVAEGEYKKEYDSCLKGKGLVPENVK